MAVIPGGYNNPTPETARQKLERKMSNAEIAKRYRENKQISAEPKDRVITPKDEDIETREQRRVKRFKTRQELRRQVKLLEEVVRSGRNAITEEKIAGYRVALRKRKHKLLLEKLRRLEAQQEG